MRDELFSICRQQKARIKLHIRRTYSMNPEVEYWQRLPSEMMYDFSRCFFPDSRKKPPGSTLFANVGKTDRKGLEGSVMLAMFDAMPLLISRRATIDQE